MTWHDQCNIPIIFYLKGFKYMTLSILQETSRREQGDFVEINVIELINQFDKLGLLLIPKSLGGYVEQEYLSKTISRDTAYHGKYKQNFVFKDNSAIGIALFSSNDCSFPTVCYLGLTKGIDVIPMLEIYNVKHLSNQVNMASFDGLKFRVESAKVEIVQLLNKLRESPTTSEFCSDVYKKIMDQAQKDMARIFPRHCVNKLSLFLNLTSDFLYGTGIRVASPNGDTNKAYTDLRKHRNYTKRFLEALK